MKYYGKEKCRILKQIRAEIAQNNGIEYIIEECPHQGNCKGTCPKCEAEVRELEQKLEERRKAGKRVAVAGIAAGMSLSVMSGCVFDKTGGARSGGSTEKPESAEYSPIIDGENSPVNTPGVPAETIMGDMAYIPEETEAVCPEEPDELPDPGELPDWSEIMGGIALPDDEVAK